MLLCLVLIYSAVSMRIFDTVCVAMLSFVIMGVVLLIVVFAEHQHAVVMPSVIILNVVILSVLAQLPKAIYRKKNSFGSSIYHMFSVQTHYTSF